MIKLARGLHKLKFSGLGTAWLMEIKIQPSLTHTKNWSSPLKTLNVWPGLEKKIKYQPGPKEFFQNIDFYIHFVQNIASYEKFRPKICILTFFFFFYFLCAIFSVIIDLVNPSSMYWSVKIWKMVYSKIL